MVRPNDSLKRTNFLIIKLLILDKTVDFLSNHLANVIQWVVFEVTTHLSCPKICIDDAAWLK
jgi:hypothetical protein